MSGGRYEASWLHPTGASEGAWYVVNYAYERVAGPWESQSIAADFAAALNMGAERNK